MNDEAIAAPRLEQRLAALRGEAPHRGLDARALAALAANPGCHRRAVLDAVGVDKNAVAERLGQPAPFGRSPFAITRGLVFERRVLADGGAELVELLSARAGLPAPGPECPLADPPDLLAKNNGPAVRTARTAEALSAAASGAWTVLQHPMLRLDVAGSPAYLEPDAIVVRPDGRLSVVEIKSFPILDGSADPAKVGAAARQAAVYVLALGERADSSFLLVCPRDFSNGPTAALLDVRRELGVTRRQLDRLTGVERLLAELPEGAVLDPSSAPDSLTAAVDSIPAAYTPDCLSTCELAFHCRARARAAQAVDVLGRGARADLGAIRDVPTALAEATTSGPLSRAATLRAEALSEAAR